MTTPRSESDPALPNAADTPPHRYDASLANVIERTWQSHWEEQGVFHTANPAGPLADGYVEHDERPRVYVLDMFPYPSGSGLHVGHPLGYIGTDVYARYWRMKGANVLHPFGYDSFGLPAERYAIEHGEHPRVTTEANIATMRRQLRRLGLAHDPRREIATSDPSFYRWTQWIFIQIFNAWFDQDLQRARPISELVAELDSGTRQLDGESWAELDKTARRRIIDSFRLAYLDDALVNWCPGLGTVLANEEVTADGRSTIGNHQVQPRRMRQWKLRITAYAERLLEDLESIDWPNGIKSMQRNWIGRSEGARIAFKLDLADTNGGSLPPSIEVFTTRPDTIFGATFLVVAPEHPVATAIASPWPGRHCWPWGVPAAWRGSPTVGAPSFGWTSAGEAVSGYRSHALRKSDVERQMDTDVKTGVFSGVYAINPATKARVPVFVADYVLMNYGTGAIMAVPAHDQRDFDFARALKLPVVAVVLPRQEWLGEHMLTEETRAAEWPIAYTGEGVATHSTNASVELDGLSTTNAKRVATDWLETEGLGRRQTTYRLRDWLFSRQRYWGEPFPIVFDEDGLPVALPEDHLPVELPELEDFAPRAQSDDDSFHSEPEYPLARAIAWTHVTLDLGDGPKVYRREVNTMPQWAGSSWYYLRYLDPTNTETFVSSEVERYWMSEDSDSERKGRPRAGVDLYVGGVEHAIGHLLYARFWHKVLFDLGHVSTPEPFRRLFNQGYVQAAAYTDDRGVYVPAEEVEKHDDGTYWWHGAQVNREYGKMGKSLKNSVAPDAIYEAYGADTLRLYEMFGPMTGDRPWQTKDIVGVYRFLQRLWRNLIDENTGMSRVIEDALDGESRKLLHRTIDTVGEDLRTLSFNTAIARLMELNRHLTGLVDARGGCPREAADPIVLMLAPLAPHIAEELWSRSGHQETLAYEPFPESDPDLLLEQEIEMGIEIDGRVRGRITVPADATSAEIEEAAMGDAGVVELTGGRRVARTIVVPGRMVSIVTDQS